MTPKEALNNLIHHIYSEGSMDVNERENYRHIIQKSFDEHEALKKDVARYFELEKESFNPLKARAYVELYGKLSKAGKEE